MVPEHLGGLPRGIGGIFTCEPLESVFPPSRGGHGAFGANSNNDSAIPSSHGPVSPMAPMAPIGRVRSWNRQCDPWKARAHGTPPPLGGGKYSREGKFVANLLVNLLII